jgi:serine/threonine protein kinase
MCKLSDFGSSVNKSVLSEAADDSQSAQQEHLVVNGTPLYMAPEACRGACGPQQDIWSIGITALELLTGGIEWTSSKSKWNPSEFVRALGNDPQMVPVIPDTVPENAAEFLRMCLQRDPLQRPSALKLLDCPFLTR